MAALLHPASRSLIHFPPRSPPGGWRCCSPFKSPVHSCATLSLILCGPADTDQGLYRRPSQRPKTTEGKETPRAACTQRTSFTKTMSCSPCLAICILPISTCQPHQSPHHETVPNHLPPPGEVHREQGQEKHRDVFQVLVFFLSTHLFPRHFTISENKLKIQKDLFI